MSTWPKPLKIYDRLQRELEIDEINEGVFWKYFFGFTITEAMKLHSSKKSNFKLVTNYY